MPLLAAVALTVAQTFDLVTFVAMVVQMGLEAELNPYVQRLASQLGLPGILLGKGALIVYLVAVVSVTAARHPKIAGVVAVLGTYAGLVGGVSNIATL